MILGDIDVERNESTTDVKVFVFLLRAWAVIALIAIGTQAQAGQVNKSAPSGEGTLMLVREWDPATGSLTGWLPNHTAAIQLELLDKSQEQHFDPEEVVYLRWPRRPHSEPEVGQVLVSPAPRTFDGQTWLPVKRDPNVVRIGKGVYVVRRFMLGESKWRLPLRTSAPSRSLASNKSPR